MQSGPPGHVGRGPLAALLYTVALRFFVEQNKAASVLTAVLTSRFSAFLSEKLIEYLLGFVPIRQHKHCEDVTMGSENLTVHFSEKTIIRLYFLSVI